MLSHLPTNAQDAQPVEEEDILEHESHPAFALPIPLTDPYFTLLTSINQLTLSHFQLREDFYYTTYHFAAPQRYVEMHLTQIQNHLGYQMPLLLNTCILFHTRIFLFPLMLHGKHRLLLMLLVIYRVMEMAML